MFFLLKILSYAYFFLMCRADKGIRPYSIGFLLDVVAGELLTEGGGGAVLVLGLIEHGNSCVQRGADDQILLQVISLGACA